MFYCKIYPGGDWKVPIKIKKAKGKKILWSTILMTSEKLVAEIKQSLLEQKKRFTVNELEDCTEIKEIEPIW